jgi:small-conductance mechanosensitive channel
MLARRAFYYWQFPAAVLLPGWLLVGWSLWGDGSGFVGIALTAPLLVVAVLVVAGLTVARRSVREAKAVSWLDFGVAGLWHLLIIGLGFFGQATNLLAVLAVAAGIAAFWLVIWELVDETRKRVRRVFEQIDRAARPSPPQSRTPIDAGEYIVLPPNDQRP